MVKPVIMLQLVKIVYEKMVLMIGTIPPFNIVKLVRMVKRLNYPNR